MIMLYAIGLCVTVAYLLLYRVKSRQWRKWLGIILSVSGAIATFKIPRMQGEFDVGMIAFIVWMCGLHLFFERARYEDEE